MSKLKVNDVVWREGVITHIVNVRLRHRTHYAGSVEHYIYTLADGRRYQIHQLFPANRADALEYKLCCKNLT